MINKIVYLGYYLKTTDYRQFLKFYRYTDKLKVSIFQILVNSFKYKISFLEFFQFEFYKLSHLEKLKWAGTSYMYEYQRKMNPVRFRKVLEDKSIFLKKYKNFINHKFITLDELETDARKSELFLNNFSKNDKIVLKSTDGQCGKGIKIFDFQNLNKEKLIEKLKNSSNDMAEEFVQQHSSLNELSPSGLNTLRIITQINKSGNVDILGARLRITVDCSVDNLAAGNIAAPVNIETGVINGRAIYSDISKVPVKFHPITNKQILDFKIPFFHNALDMVKEAALFDTSNKSIGWDVAITKNGPELIEGNHDWCKLLWQLPVQKGLKTILEDYKLSKK